MELGSSRASYRAGSQLTQACRCDYYILFGHQVSSSGWWGRSGVTYISTVSMIRAILRWLYVVTEVITRMILKVCLGNLTSGCVDCCCWFFCLCLCVQRGVQSVWCGRGGVCVCVRKGARSCLCTRHRLTVRYCSYTHTHTQTGRANPTRHPPMNQTNKTVIVP